MSTARDILLGDAKESLLRVVRPLVGRNDHNEAFAAWLIGPHHPEVTVSGPCQTAVVRPIGQKNYRDVATLGYAAAALGFAFSHASLLTERLSWLSGRDLSMAGISAGFVTDSIALLGTALGAHSVADGQLIEKVAGWMNRFASSSFDNTRASDRDKCLAAAALRLVGSSLTIPLPSTDRSADVRVALRSRNLLPSVHQGVADAEEASALRLMLEAAESLAPVDAALRLAAFEDVKDAARSASYTGSFILPASTHSSAEPTGSASTVSANLTSPRVFISYSWEDADHNDKAVGLANALRWHGLEAMIDVYVNGTPAEGWPIWMTHQVVRADFVLIVCTETYRRRFERKEQAGSGKGVKWEGAIITQSIYEDDSKNTKFVPVVFKRCDFAHIPLTLKSASHYDLSDLDQFEKLYRHLTDQPLVVAPPVGPRVVLPPRDIKPFKPGS